MSTMPGRKYDSPSESTFQEQGTPREIVTSRRALAGALGAFGLAALAGCSQDSAGADGADTEGIDALAEALGTTATVKVADTAANLRALAGGATSWVAVLEGVTTSGDGGGGVFYWSTTAKADDGWSTLNNGSGNTAGWRRVNAGFVTADTVAVLRTLPGGTGRTFALLAANSAPGDGGGGLFVWSTTAAPDNGGTVLNQASGNAAGWRRIYEGALNVRWFGAKGDNSAADDVAIQKAFNAAFAQQVQLIPPNTSGSFGITMPKIFFPKGIYRITQPIQAASAESDGFAILQASADTFPIFIVPGSGIEISNLTFHGGTNQIVIGGNGSDPGAGGMMRVWNCCFKASAMSAIWQDPAPLLGYQPQPRRGSSLSLFVDNCEFQGVRFFTGNYDRCQFSRCRVWFEPDFPSFPAPSDYTAVACFNSASNLVLSNTILIGSNVSGASNRAAYIRCGGGLTMTDCQIGDLSCVAIRVTDPSTDPQDFLPPEGFTSIYLRDTVVASSTQQQYWLELLRAPFTTAQGGPIYSGFPTFIQVANCDITQSAGIFVRNVADGGCAPGARCFIDIDGHFLSAYRFHGKPGGVVTDLGLPDITSQYTAFVVRPGTGGEDVSVVDVPQENLFTPFKILDTDTTNTVYPPGTWTALPAPEAITGYGMRVLVASVNVSSYSNTPAWTPPSGCLPGEYVFSMYIMTTFDGIMQFGTSNSAGPQRRLINSGGAFRRVWFRFYSDGVSSLPFQIAVLDVPAGGSLSLGLFAVHKGNAPAPYLVPGNPAPASAVRQINHLSGLPPTGPTTGIWKVGDVIYNASPAPGGNRGWICTTAGTAGSGAAFKTFGTIAS